MYLNHQHAFQAVFLPHVFLLRQKHFLQCLLLDSRKDAQSRHVDGDHGVDDRYYRGKYYLELDLDIITILQGLIDKFKSRCSILIFEQIYL